MKIKMMQYKEFESRNKTGRFVRLSYDMLNSEAWKDLKTIAVKLYVYLKTKYNGSEISIEFECSYSEINNKLRFSDKSIKSAYDDLIAKGFVEVLENNRARMKANKYKFSEKWKHYGKPNFEYLAPLRKVVIRKDRL